jgi:Uncharacterised nucleotidyltransferase
MSTSDTASPSAPLLHVALRDITEKLACELGSPTRHAPDWSDLEWRIARSVAAMHGVSPLLSRTLLWRGPPGWVRFLEEQRTHTEKRHAHIAELLQSIGGRAHEAAVAVIALKGLALHAMDVYAIGERPMADIDLLVRPRDAQRAGGLLESLGYHESLRSWKEQVFSPLEERIPGALGEHSNNAIKIDLHDRICERLPWFITDATEHMFPPHAQAGLNSYPTRASLMLHLLLHAAGSMTTRALRLLQLNDIARLSSRMTDIDWDQLLASGERGPGLWWALPPLRLVARYYPSTIPDHVLATAAASCPWVLKSITANRALYDVSYSYPWVDAFPGIEWAQSFREVTGYVAARIRPNSTHIELRKKVAASEAWAAGNQWSELSQTRRILRWLTSRPARSMTMHAVNAALAQAQ